MRPRYTRDRAEMHEVHLRYVPQASAKNHCYQGDLVIRAFNKLHEMLATRVQTYADGWRPPVIDEVSLLLWRCRCCCCCGGGGDQCRCCGQVIDIREEAPGSSDEAESAARWCYAKVSSHPPPAPFRDIMPSSLTFFLFEARDVLLCGIYRSRWCAPTATSP